MAEFKTIPIDQIIVPERLRAVEEEHAIAIAKSIVEHGLLNPITVRFVPAAKGGNYILIAGAHRLRAVQINDENSIDTMIVAADQAEAQLVEITENLFRNDLSVMDRAVFVATYRDVWEQKHGVINQKGGRPKNDDKLSLFFEGGFSEHVADRLGLSKRSIERLHKISRHLHPDIRSAIRGTAVADNQSSLLKLAKLEPAKQRQAAMAFRETPDLKVVFSLIDDRPKPARPDKQALLLSALIDSWSRANPETRQKFLDHVALENERELAA